MNTFWEICDWKPTDPHMNLCPEHKPGKSDIQQARTDLIRAATVVKGLPYRPQGWLDRSAELLILGFPDLAIADAYKAMLLCKAGLNADDLLAEHVRLVVGLHMMVLEGLAMDMGRKRLHREIKEILKINLGHSYLLQIEALKRLDATADVIAICLSAIKAVTDHEYLRTFSSELEKARSYFLEKVTILNSQGLDFDDLKRRLIFGGWNPNIYPWMPSQHRTRNLQTIKKANCDLKTCSDNIEIRVSPMQGIDDCYGAFATRKIRAGEKVLGGTFPFVVSPEQGVTQCLNCFKAISIVSTMIIPHGVSSARYCSPECLSNAQKYYHDAICDRNFSSILNRAQQLYGGNAEGLQCGKKGATEIGQITGWQDKPSKGYPLVGRPLPDQTPCVMIRMLAMCVQAGGNPLEHPLVAQLVQGPPMVIERFSMNGMVIAPIEALQVLGIDIFGDDRYETWVLRTIWMRIANNVMGSEAKGYPNWVLGPFCWFNHSCDPNTGPGPRWGQGINEDQIALRGIEKGEEICVSYIDVLGDKATRAKMLMGWFGDECKCPKCKRES